MKTKYMQKIAVFCAAIVALTSCKDYLTEIQPGVTSLDNYFTSGQAAVMDVTGCYVPLMWEYNYTYYSEWFIGDIVSDDALKGGENITDMASVYEMENWKTTITNDLLLDFWRAQYQGIARCNLALKYVPTTPADTVMTDKMRDRLIGEAEYLRAYYYFRMLRVFGGVPLVTKVIDSSDEWNQPRASVEDVFNQILTDLTDAQKKLWLKSEYSANDLGRATKGAAEAMLMKTYLYMASPYWHDKWQLSDSRENYYKKAKQWGDSIINSNEYDLNPTFFDNFTLAGENGIESVFEIQYAEVYWGDYGGSQGEGGNGYTAGSFTPILVRSRSSLIGGGWGFNKPTWNLYYEYEANDSIRRDAAILNPADSLMQKKAQEIYLGTPLLNNKYAMYTESPGTYRYHDSRGPINNKQIRYSDVLLMYAEACVNCGYPDLAKAALNRVRQRAGLSAYENENSYTFTPNAGDGVAGTQKHPTLEEAIRHERRVELAMEGHRWFDLVRWYGGDNGLDTYMNVTYPATESAAARDEMGTFVKHQHELFPIPVEEIQLNAMTQNEGY